MRDPYCLMLLVKVSYPLFHNTSKRVQRLVWWGCIFRYVLLYSDMYEKKEKLKLEKQIAVTKEIYDVLRKEKRKQKISMAKIVCNLVLEKYEKEK